MCAGGHPSTHLRREQPAARETRLAYLRPFGRLRLQYLPLREHALQQRPHAEFLRDGDGLVLEFGDLVAITGGVDFKQHLCVIRAGPCESRPVADSAAESHLVLEMARRIVEERGWVSDPDLQRVRDAGYGDAEIVEIIATVAATTFTNYFNHIAQTEVDFPLVEVGQPTSA